VKEEEEEEEGSGKYGVEHSGNIVWPL